MFRAVIEREIHKPIDLRGLRCLCCSEHSHARQGLRTNASLTELDLSHNPLGHAAAASLAATLDMCPRVTVCRLGPEGLSMGDFKGVFRDGGGKKKGKKKKKK